MHPEGAHEEVDDKTDAEAREQQLPSRHVDRQQHHEDEVDIGMHIAAQSDVVDDQHLGHHEQYETDDIDEDPVHCFWFLTSASSSALLVWRITYTFLMEEKSVAKRILALLSVPLGDWMSSVTVPAMRFSGKMKE